MNKIIKQVNYTVTNIAGSVRGLHFQVPPFAEIKLVTCIKGTIFDVAVDIRENSPTFLQYESRILSAESNLSFLIPEGFAHGFQTLEANCEILYLHSEEHKPHYEKKINVKDPKIGISWPLEITNISQDHLSAKFI